MALNLPTLTFHAYRSFCVHSYDIGAFQISFGCKFSLGLNHHYYKRGVNSGPDSLTNLVKRVRAALVQSGVPAFLPISSTLSPQESLRR